jgi:hypothetical protein
VSYAKHLGLKNRFTLHVMSFVSVICLRLVSLFGEIAAACGQL